MRVKIKDLVKNIILEDVAENHLDILVDEKFCREALQCVSTNKQVPAMFILEEPKVDKQEMENLFEKMLLAINLNKNDVCIVKFKELTELQILEEQVKKNKPKLIILMGNTASRTILGTEKDIRETRGELFKYKNIPVIPTLHPSYLLREPDGKKVAWEDFKKIRDFLK